MLDGADAEGFETTVFRAFLKSPVEVMKSLVAVETEFGGGDAFANYDGADVNLSISTDRPYPLIAEFVKHLRLGAAGRLPSAAWSKALLRVREEVPGPQTAFFLELVRAGLSESAN